MCWKFVNCKIQRTITPICVKTDKNNKISVTKSEKESEIDYSTRSARSYASFPVQKCTVYE